MKRVNNGGAAKGQSISLKWLLQMMENISAVYFYRRKEVEAKRNGFVGMSL